MPFLTIWTALQIVVHTAAAAQSGNVRGYVTDEQSVPIPNAKVILSGDEFAGEIATTTGDDGSFNFIGLPLGEHEILVLKKGMQPVTLVVTIRLDETRIVPVTLTATGAEEPEEQATAPTLDPTRSAVSTEFDRPTLDRIPLQERSYQWSSNLVAGVQGRINYSAGGGGDGNPSVRGEGAYGNNYLVDGMSTRNPKTKGFGVTLPYDAVESIQVYTDGASAEFGQATGMTMNVVTKDGGDVHSGSAAYLVDASASSTTYPIADLALGKEAQTEPREFFSQSFVGTVGGPILRERLWYFAAADVGFGSKVSEGGDPEVPQRFTRGTAFAKLSLFATPALTLRLQTTLSGSDTANTQNSAMYAREAQSDLSVFQQSHMVRAEVLPSPNDRVDVKLLYQVDQSINAPSSGATQTPQILDKDSGIYGGNALALTTDSLARSGASVSYTHLLTDWFGTHMLKGGVEFVRVSDNRAVDWTGPGEGATYYASAASGRPCISEDYSDCSGYREYQEVGGALGHADNIVSAFIQDDWTASRRFSVNAGVRLDHETVFENGETRVASFLMPAPRLGMVWDATADGRTLLSVNAGRYYDVSGIAFAAWFDSLSPNVFRYYAWDADADEYALVYEQDQTASPYVACTNEGLASLSGEQRQVADTVCGGGLQPYHLDKLVIDATREWLPGLSGGLRGIVSKTSGFMEDVNVDGQTSIIANTDAKSRDYHALELHFERAFQNSWQVFGSYTWSESRGTSPGNFEVTSTSGRVGSYSNDVSTFGDDVDDLGTRADLFDAGDGDLLEGYAGLGTTTDDAGMYGYLPYNSFHVVKLAGAYTAPFGTTFSVVYEFDSGHAWEKRGYVSNYMEYFSFPQGRGSRTMPPVHYLDLSIAHTFTFTRHTSLSAQIDVFNPFNFDAPITYYENDDANFGLTMYRQAPRAVRVSVGGAY